MSSRQGAGMTSLLPGGGYGTQKTKDSSFQPDVLHGQCSSSATSTKPYVRPPIWVQWPTNLHDLNLLCCSYTEQSLTMLLGACERLFLAH